jgi:hypothetical protein
MAAMLSRNTPRATPAAIVEPGGQVNTGWFTSPFRGANLGQAPARHLLSRLRETPLGGLERWYRGMRLKNWHYTSVSSPELFFACAIVDAGYIGTSFAYVVDRRTSQMHEWTTLAPMSSGIRIADNSLDGSTTVEQRGFGTIALGNDSASGLRTVEAHLDGALGRRTKPPLHARFEIWDWGKEPDPIVVVEESDRGRWLYTHKCYGLEAQGTLRCGDLEQTVAPGSGHAGLDWNLGYRPNETYWNWAAGGGSATDGTRIGFNLTAHRAWDGSSDDDHGATDSALWIGGRCIKLDRVEFDYDHRAMMRPWHIKDDRGLCRLRFTPLGKRSDDVNLGLVVSRFHQPYGRFEGELRTPEGDEKVIDDVFGVTEQHFARW